MGVSIAAFLIVVFNSTTSVFLVLVIASDFISPALLVLETGLVFTLFFAETSTLGTEVLVTFALVALGLGVLATGFSVSNSVTSESSVLLESFITLNGLGVVVE